MDRQGAAFMEIPSLIGFQTVKMRRVVCSQQEENIAVEIAFPPVLGNDQFGGMAGFAKIAAFRMWLKQQFVYPK